jgi:hypothetical protein
MSLPMMEKPEFQVRVYPPSDPKDQKEAKEGMSWADIGAPEARSAWEIIYYNFRTFIPNHVNWYMWHYLGRTKLAKDGINMTFGVDPKNSDATRVPPERFRPGIDRPFIYIPPSAWIAPAKEDEHLRIGVITALTGPSIPGTHFSTDIGFLHAGELFTVVERIRARRIEVRLDTALEGQPAFYKHRNRETDGNTLFCKFAFPNDHWDWSVIVHEAVHAACDLRSHAMPLVNAESIAYIAQAIYLRKQQQTPHDFPDPGLSNILGFAEAIGDTLMRGESEAAAQRAGLRNAVTTVHSRIEGKNVRRLSLDYDGVP